MTEGVKRELPPGFAEARVQGYLLERILPDGRIAAVGMQGFGAHITISKPEEWHDRGSWQEQFMFDHPVFAFASFMEWNGEGEPEHWVRHAPSWRRRPDGDPEKEYVQP